MHPCRTPTLIVALLAMIATAGAAQQVRRSATPAPDSGSKPAHAVSLPDIPRDPAHPLVGVWEGEMTPGRGAPVPFAVVVEFLNGGYHLYWSSNGGAPAVPVSESASGDTLRWEAKNEASGGPLLYTAHLVGADQLVGVMSFKDFTPTPGMPGPRNPTFDLHRRVPAHR